MLRETVACLFLLLSYIIIYLDPGELYVFLSRLKIGAAQPVFGLMRRPNLGPLQGLDLKHHPLGYEVVKRKVQASRKRFINRHRISSNHVLKRLQ